MRGRTWSNTEMSSSGLFELRCLLQNVSTASSGTARRKNGRVRVEGAERQRYLGGPSRVLSTGPSLAFTVISLSTEL